jgi:hypothetical protein
MDLMPATYIYYGFNTLKKNFEILYGPRPYWEKVDGILKKKLVWSNTIIKN